jgi:hypothetical protein
MGEREVTHLELWAVPGGDVPLPVVVEAPVLLRVDLSFPAGWQRPQLVRRCAFPAGLCLSLLAPRLQLHLLRVGLL